jgi:protein-tyrosine-phosphatase
LFAVLALERKKMRHTLLFLCPHGAAKSVIAAAYCQQVADQYSLDVQATSAGTEPSAQVSPAVVELLQAEGINVANNIPQLVTTEALMAASHVISLGCDLDNLLPPGTLVERWDDVPLPSQDLAAARDSIYAHVEQLINNLRKA